MRRLWQWLTIQLPEQSFAWLLAATRRPRTFIVALIVIPLTAALALTYTANVSMWRERALQYLLVTARLGAHLLEETLTDTWHFERIVTAQPAFLDAARGRHTAQLNRILKDAVELIPKVDLALFVSLDGRVLASSGEPEWVGRDISGEDSFQGARQGGWQPYVSGVYLRGESLEKVVGVVWPVTHRGELIGLLQVQYRLETIRAWLAKIRVEPGGFLYIVDHRDQLVVYPFQVMPGRPKVVSDWPPVASPVTNEGRTLVFRGGRRVTPWLAGIMPIGSFGWRVVAVQPETAALQPLQRLFWTLVLVIGLLSIGVLTIGLRWARIQAMSLQLLRQNAKLLKQLQQHRLMERGNSERKPGEPSS